MGIPSQCNPSSGRSVPATQVAQVRAAILTGESVFYSTSQGSRKNKLEKQLKILSETLGTVGAPNRARHESPMVRTKEDILKINSRENVMVLVLWSSIGIDVYRPVGGRSDSRFVKVARLTCLLFREFSTEH